MTTNNKTVLPKLTLRPAESTKDLEFMRPLSLEFHKESHFGDIPYSHKKRDILLGQALTKSDQFAVMIAEYDGQPVGFLFCAINEYIVGEEDLITTILSFFISKKYRNRMIGARAAMRLLKGAVKWSEMRNSREIMIHVTSGIDIQRTDRFLRKAGFGVLGGNYALPLRANEIME